MKKLTVCLLVTLIGGSASAGRRITFDQKNFNRAFIEIDTVVACNGQKTCEVEVVRGQKVKIVAGDDKLNSFSEKDEFTAEGLISDTLGDATLPSNPCIYAPATISAIYWKPNFESKGWAPSNWDSATQTFKDFEEVDNDFGVRELPEKTSKVCFAPKKRKVRQKAGAKKVEMEPGFSVMWLRLDMDLSLEKQDVSFSNQMRFSTQTIYDRTEEAINNVGLILEDEELVKNSDELGLLDQALRGLRAAVRPRGGGLLDYPSAASDRVRRAAHVVLQAWSFVGPKIQEQLAQDLASEKRATKKQVNSDSAAANAMMSSNIINQHIRLLVTDIESLRKIYGDPASGDFGQSKFVASVADLLLVQAHHMSSAEMLAKVESLPRATLKEWLIRFKDRVLAIKNASLQNGDQSDAVSKAVAGLVAFWNLPPSQKVILAIGNDPDSREELRVILAFSKSLQNIDPASKIALNLPEFDVITDSVAGNGGAVKCSMDALGNDYCLVDLLHQCKDRTACSTKLSFNGHWVAATSKTGLFPLRKAGYGFVYANSARRALPEGNKLPANTEVCSDLKITHVKYQEKSEGTRWTMIDGEILKGKTKDQKTLSTTFPDPSVRDPKLINSKCIRFQADLSEPEYAITAVRLKVDLDRDRGSLLPNVMTTAGLRLKQDLEYTKREVSDRVQAMYPEFKSVFRDFDLTIGELISSIDTSKFDFKKVNVPITQPMVRVHAARLYGRTELLRAAIRGMETGMAGQSRYLDDLALQLRLGFGFDNGRSEEEMSTPNVTKTLDEIRSIFSTARSSFAGWEFLRDHKTPAGYEYRAVSTVFFENLSLAAATLIDTKGDARGFGVYSPQTVQAVRTILISGKGLMALVGRYQKYAELVQKLKEFREQVLSAFAFSEADSQAVIKGSYKAEPLLEALHFAFAELTAVLGMRWGESESEAVDSILNYLRERMIPEAVKSGDEALKAQLPGLAKLWKKPAVAVLFEDLKQYQGSTVRDYQVRQMSNVISETLAKLAEVLKSDLQAAGIHGPAQIAR